MENKKDIGVICSLEGIGFPKVYSMEGKYYATMFSSEPIETQTFNEMCEKENIDTISCIFMTAHNLEEDSKVMLLQFKDKIYHLREDSFDELIIYKTLFDNALAFACKIETFNEKIDK